MTKDKWLAPMAVLLVALVGAVLLVATAPSVENVPPERALTTVRVVPAQPEDVRLWVRTQGTVAPRTESSLIPEVSGRVVWVAPSLASGGFFAEGDALLRVEAGDYEMAVSRARANVARAAGEAEHARSELERRETLSERQVASDSQLSEARRASRVGSATLSEARVALEQAERDLARTEVRAPFAGRVREERVDVGQFVSRGASVATLYATDVAEIRLPIADRQLAFLDFPGWRSGSVDEGPEVTLRARFAGREHEWSGRVVRTEGEIDAKSRMVHVVARVDDPYGGPEADDRPAFAVGLFVHAEIAGPLAENVIVLPREAMRNEDRILVVDADDRLRYRGVEVLRIDRDDVLIRADIAASERIVLSPLQVAVEGMKVRPLEGPGARAASEAESDAASPQEASPARERS
jgi:RND family efflux transporter MFP subunit